MNNVISCRMELYMKLGHAIPPVSFVFPAVYHALYLEELTLLDLSEKIAMLYSITPQQITHIYRQKPTGIHVLVSDEVSLHLPYQPLTLHSERCCAGFVLDTRG